jgi:moderate conductance mechanosensitive channel
VRARLITLAGVIVSLFAVMASLPASADELAFQRLAGLASVDVSANLQALRDDFAQAPSEAQRLGAGIGAALSDGTAVRAVTFVLILVIAGAGLEWLYWTFAAAPLRAIISTSAATLREAAVLALRRLGLLGFGLVLFTASTVGAALTLPWPADVEAVVIAATALVVTVRSVWMSADLVVSPHHPSLRLAPIQRYKSELVVGGVAWLSLLAATAILLPQLLLTVASAPHLAGTIRVGVGAVIVISLLTAVLIASLQGSRSGKGRRGRPRFPKAFVATFVIVATAVLALVGGSHIAALLVDIAIVAALLGAPKRIVFFFWRDATGKDEEPVAETLPDMLPLIVLAVFRFAILLTGIAGLILIMRVPLAELTTGSNPLAQFALRVAETVALAFVVYVGWIAIRFAIDRRLRQLAPLDPHSSPTENTRLLTLLPLLRTTLAIVFVMVFTLSALWTLGIQIAPLLAGSGYIRSGDWIWRTNSGARCDFS